MAASPPIDGPGLEVTSPDGSIRFIRISDSPFLIGRGFETGNHLHLTDRRISRLCAAIITEGDRYCLEDRGHRYGIFVNGKKMDRRILEDGDAISFGFEDSYKIIFRTNADDKSIQNMLDRIGTLSTVDAAPEGLRKLNLLLEATSLLHSQLPLDSVLGTMLNFAISITDADRGLLLEADSSGLLSVRIARGIEGERLSPESLSPSQTALRMALEQNSSVITEDLNLSDLELQVAESIVAQQLRAIVVIPLYAMPRSSSISTIDFRQGLFLGVIYLDSRRPAAFSKLDRQILDARWLPWLRASCGERHQFSLSGRRRRLLRRFSDYGRPNGLSHCRRFGEGFGRGVTHDNASGRTGRHDDWRRSCASIPTHQSLSL